MKKMSLIVAVALLLLAALPAAAATAKIKQNRTPMRAEATTTSTVVAYYQAGDLLLVLNVDKSWYKVRDVVTGQEGFVLSTLAELLPGDPAGMNQPERPASATPSPATVPQPPPATAPQPPPATPSTVSAPQQPPAATPPAANAAQLPKAAAQPTPPVAKSPAKTAAPPSAPKSTAPAKAQPASRWTDIGYLSVDGGYQSGSSGFSSTFSFATYVEQSTISTQYPKKDGPTFNVGGGFRVWRNLAVGFGVSALKRSTSGEVSGSIPHPFFFNTGRAVAATADLKRSETGVHLQAAYVIPAGRKMLITLAGGPSFFSVTQSLVDSVQFAESYPYDTAALQPVTAVSVSKSVTGYNGGVDLGYYFARAIGVGVMARYAGATASLPVKDGTVSTKVGGFQAGVGVRVRIPKSAPKKTAPKPPAIPMPAPVKK